MPARWASENLRLVLKQSDELGDRRRALSDDPAALAVRGKLRLHHLEPWRVELCRFRLERLLLRGHDSLERRIPRSRDAFVDAHHRRQRELHDLGAALELARSEEHTSEL